MSFWSDFALQFIEEISSGNGQPLLFIPNTTFTPQVGDLVDANDGMEYKVISVKWHLSQRVVVASVVKVNE